MKIKVFYFLRNFDEFSDFIRVSLKRSSVGEKKVPERHVSDDHLHRCNE